MNELQIQLDSGWWVRCETVPPLAVAGIRENRKYWLPHPPEIEVKTVAGSEKITAPYQSEKYQAYSRQVEEMQTRIERDQRNFTYALGVVEWSEDGEKWSDKPPKGWKPNPRILEAQGLEEGDIEARTAWIIYGLIRTNSDLIKINQAVLSREMNPITGEEVSAVEDFFRSDVEGDAAEGGGEGSAEG
jgi:hypothetical protein